MRWIILFMSLWIFRLLPAQPLADRLPNVSAGKIIRHASFPSTHVSARHVDVWLPRDYDARKRYAVWYMQDGQMLFDSTLTWNKQEWGVDETFQSLIDEGKIAPGIVVGIWNSGSDRHPDYFPQKPFEKIDLHTRDSILSGSKRPGGQTVFTRAPQSDAYLKFLVEELKPFIDRSYSTHRDAAHTYVMGSSMGGLISWYAVCEYPNLFGSAGCLSTHWPGVFAEKKNPIPGAFLKYLEDRIPKPKKHRFYFDHGTVGLDYMYGTTQTKVDELFKQKGYPQTQYRSLLFQGADHSERAWRARLPETVLFLASGH